MKVSLNEEITFTLKIIDPEKASVLCGNIFASHGGDQTPYEGVIAIVSARSNPFTECDEANDLLNEVHEYLTRNHLGNADAEALLDKIEGNAGDR